MEIPTKIRFDVFLVIAGASIITGILEFHILTNIYLEFIGLALGAFLLIVGVNLIKSNYDMETELETFDYVQRKVEYMKYFERENLLVEMTKDRNRKQMIAMVN
ncbi:hypothetical protein HZA99_06445 [Candidatus Woesearchaeota archaeon]|nr:hypothetical protein [Candidatus Woesearchaeota archaeon]